MERIRKTYWTWFAPKEIIKNLPFHGAGWWLSGKVDSTTITRLILAPLGCLIWPGLPLIFEAGIFAEAGTANQNAIDDGHKQGGNVLDLGAVWVWVLLWFVFGLPSWF